MVQNARKSAASEASASPPAGQPPKSRRGGRRPGAGRKKKVHVAPTIVTDVEFAAALAEPPPAEIDVIAQLEAVNTIAVFVRQMMLGESEAAKIAAANAILDRGYGKPAVEIGGDAAMPMLPFMMAPGVAPAVTGTAEVRAEAQKYARLAIEVLKKIRDKGTSESARVSAGKSLLDRGYGTVGKARMPDEQRDRPLGKKEEAQRAAEAAATGRYATPPPPKAMAERLQ